MTSRQITNVDITTAYGATADGSSWVTKQAPNTKSFMETHQNETGVRIRTFDQSTGRMDLYSNSAASQTVGPAMVIAFDNATPANNDILGHYAYRGRDSGGNFNTFAYVLGTAKTISATGSNLSSSITFGVMVAQTAGAGNAQPNTFMVLDGSASQLTMPSGFQISLSGTSTPITASHTSGPEVVLTNTTNSRVARFGIADNFNTIINSTGGGGIQFQVGGTACFIVSSSTASRITAELRTAKTSNYTVLSTDGGTQFDNLGAAGEVDFTLPGTPTLGTKFAFMVNAAQIVKVIAPASHTINIGGTVSAAAGNASSSQVGAYVELHYVGSSKYVAKLVTGSGGSTGAGGWTVT